MAQQAMSHVEILLSRIEKARPTGRGSWIACCPAHEDRHPSMTIRETEDGTVLVHCFSGCSVEQILAAVGLEFDALFPPRPVDHAKPMRRPFQAADVIEALARESTIVAVASANVRQGMVLSDEDHERLLVAVERLYEGRNLANGES